MSRVWLERQLIDHRLNGRRGDLGIVRGHGERNFDAVPKVAAVEGLVWLDRSDPAADRDQLTDVRVGRLPLGRDTPGIRLGESDYHFGKCHGVLGSLSFAMSPRRSFVPRWPTSGG